MIVPVLTCTQPPLLSANLPLVASTVKPSYSPTDPSIFNPFVADKSTVVVNTSNFTSLLENAKDPSDRKKIFEAVYKHYELHKNTFAIEESRVKIDLNL